ncbi:MAG: lamin tail domain-containing protein [Balneolaceae bacterium]|nr:lamin tail domain-containing protein [Balneolaceae bacterium]MBO6544807.1 lamin tail domain-containing protein [Balneolaceae bacterium]MBO6646203.1 lamin tail domain-containing protein [Balneolaceae bacterium]
MDNLLPYFFVVNSSLRLSSQVDKVVRVNYPESMKFLFTISLLLISASLFAQNFEDDFSDGDFTANPVWSGADSNFVIFDLDGNNVLRLDDNEAASSYLSTPSSNTVGEWEFFVRIDGTAPSNGNKAEIVLMSDISDLSGAVNGYAVRIGQTGDDVFKIVRLDAGAQTTVLEDTTIFDSGGSYRIKVTRDASGNWSIEVGEGYNGELKNSGNTANDNTYTSSAFFGVLVTYSSTRVDDYYFDFKVNPPPVIVDPLLVDSFSVFSETEIDFSFSRDIDFSSVATTDFELNDSINPQSFSNQGSNALRITFTDIIPGGENQLSVSGIESSVNDTVLTDTSFIFFVFDEFETGDIIINEFLKDPPPGTDLPEYIELRNTSSKYLNLKDWEIGDNNSLATISEEDLVILPDSFLVVTSDPEALTTNFGAGQYVDVSLPALNNTTDQIRVFDGTGTLIDSLEYNPDWGGVDVALERRTQNAASTLQANWGDSPDKIGTPGRTNDIEPDTTPPDIESFEFLNDSTLEIIFTEAIAQIPAETLINYELVAGSGNDFSLPGIQSVDLVEPDTVIIAFNAAFQGDGNGESYSLTIENQEDFFGNTANELTFDFEFREFDTALEGEVALNEFMYDPADAYSEFVELYNHTNKTFNLQNWTFNDNSGNRRTITFETYALSPDQFVLLAPDSTIVENFPGTPLLRVSGFPALNNSTDDLVLRDSDGVLIDSLTYSSSWGGDEISLERRSVEVSGIFQANWGDSPSPELATPGQQNAIEPDTVAPFVESVLIINAETVILNFSETLVESFALDLENYNITPTQTASEIVLNQDSVSITLAQALSDGEKLTVEVLNQRDIFGNINDSDLVEAVYFEITPALKNEVVINEILYRREDELSPEFVELYNPTNKNFDLSGWELIDAGNNDAEISEGIFLPAGEYLILTDREDFANTLSNAIYLSDFPSLNDSGDGVIIKNAEGITIDSLFYQASWGGDSPGVSLERKDPGRASNDASNWASSTAQGGFSAGAQSSVFEEDVTPPEIIFATQIDSVVQIVFSEFVRTSTQTIINVNGIDVELLELNGNQVIVEWTPAPVALPKSLNATNIDVTVSDILDIKGNVASEISSPIASPASKGDVIINEIMYDPLADPEDNLPDQTEYLELYNRSNAAISLEGIFLHDAPDEENEFQSIEPVSTQYKWIEPGGYFLIYSEDEASVFSESKTAEYFGLEGESDQFTMRVDRSSLSLASSDDAIYLADSTGATIDSVFFDESWQNPNVFDTDGIALERINPLGESNDESNWSSSTHVSGGTPNFRNTIFQDPGAPPESAGISFSPNPFSPDDDGFEDNLFINYTLDAPDYLLRVRIFDRYGRQVRELANNAQAGFMGSLTWDGLTDDRKKNRVGIYIVLFEAYNSANGSDRTFKETVVLARMF